MENKHLPIYLYCVYFSSCDNMSSVSAIFHDISPHCLTIRQSCSMSHDNDMILNKYSDVCNYFTFLAHLSTNNNVRASKSAGIPNNDSACMNMCVHEFMHQ